MSSTPAGSNGEGYIADEYKPVSFNDTLQYLKHDILADDTHKRKSSASPEDSLEKRLKPNDGRSSSERYVYGNPKEVIKSPPSDTFDGGTALDLSCKTPKLAPTPPLPPPPPQAPLTENTYHPYPRPHPYLPDAFPRSNLEIKLVNPPKRPSTSEQLQIAKIQQQQRRSVQQQQKMLQQMRRTLEGGARSSSKISSEVKEESPHPLPPPPPAFPHNPHQNHLPFMDNAGKDLPEAHPVLPLLDPVYFSALYNAHGFMPPSSPSIAAAFIGTLQDALPKLSMQMFPPSTSAPSAAASLPYMHKGDGALP